MIANFRIVAIIPARGGSKGLPGKNVIPLCGKPLIAYTIDAARQSATVDAVVVSTDDEAIASAARRAGAEVPFLRPAHLATDTAHTPPVILHALEFLEQRGDRYDVVVTLQPTSPLRCAEHIDRAVQLLASGGVDSVVGVRRTEYPPYWMVRMEGDRMVPFVQDGIDYFRWERQELPKTYQINGAVYVTRRDALIAEGKIITERCSVLVMDDESSHEIDTHADLERIAVIMRSRAMNRTRV